MTRPQILTSIAVACAVLWLGLMMYGNTTQNPKFGGSAGIMTRQTAHTLSMLFGVGAAIAGVAAAFGGHWTKQENRDEPE